MTIYVSSVASGTISCTEIIDKIAIQLLDVNNTRWSRAELLSWISDAQRQIIQLQPSASSKTVAFKMVKGTRQIMPNDAYILLDMYRNLGTDGQTPGRAMRVVSRSILDSQNPNWHSYTASAQVRNYVYDQQEPKAFYVSPPSDGTGYLEMCYSQAAPEILAESTTLIINDELQTAVVDYVLFRANSKDAEYAPGIQLAEMYLSLFQQAMGKFSGTQNTNNPDQTLGKGNAQVVPGSNS